jgi:hypothetical protein
MARGRGQDRERKRKPIPGAATTIGSHLARLGRLRGGPAHAFFGVGGPREGRPTVRLRTSWRSGTARSAGSTRGGPPRVGRHWLRTSVPRPWGTFPQRGRCAVQWHPGPPENVPLCKAGDDRSVGCTCRAGQAGERPCSTPARSARVVCSFAGHTAMAPPWKTHQRASVGRLGIPAE